MLQRNEYSWLVVIGLLAFVVSTGLAQEKAQPKADKADVKKVEKGKKAADNKTAEEKKKERAEMWRKRIEGWKKRMEEGMMKKLGVTEEEWQVLKPRIEKVQKLMGRKGGRGLRALFGRGRGRSNTDEVKSDADKASEALNELIENKTAKSADIKAAMEKLRAARKKEAAELLAARKELREVVTVKQEAILFMMQMLD